MKTFIGLTGVQFETLSRTIMPSLRRIYNDLERARTALYIYLMKLRTSHTNDEIAPLFGITTKVVNLRIRAVREILHEVFVPLHLHNSRREDLLEHTTAFSRRLYNVDDNTVIAEFDGTYIYTINSSNYIFQKETYSVQKHRNLVKFMMAVSPDGFIIGAVGPFSARKNDASILTEILNRPDNLLFKNLRRGDVIVLDRGFRDSIRTLQMRGFIVKTPANTQSAQLTRQQGNASRNTTKTRFVIEVRNGHMKNIWKYFKGVKIHQSLQYLRKDFEIAAALINAFSSLIHNDKMDWQRMAAIMAARNAVTSNFNQLVRQIPQNSFMQQNNLTLFPKLTYADLKDISQGSYQINQAASYCQINLAANNDNFPVKVCEVVACQRFCARFLTQGAKNPLLLLFNLPSRFVSGKNILLTFFSKWTRMINIKLKNIHALVKMGYEV